MYEQKEIFAGLVMFPIEKLDSLVEAFNGWLKNYGEDESALFVIGRPPPEDKVFIIF